MQDPLVYKGIQIDGHRPWGRVKDTASFIETCTMLGIKVNFYKSLLKACTRTKLSGQTAKFLA